MNNPDTLAAANGLAQKRSRVATGDDSTVRQFLGLIVRYKGSQLSALIKTAGNTAILSLIGDPGSEAADSAFTYPPAGTSGTISLDAGGFANMGQVVDFINALPGYDARLVALRRADNSSVAGALVADATVKQAKNTTGAQIPVDTSVAKHISCEISVLDGTIFKSDADTDARRVAVNELHYVDCSLVQGASDVFEVIEVDDDAKTDEVVYSSTVLIEFPNGASSTDFTNGSGIGIQGRPGRRLLVRARAASVVVTRFNVIGVQKALN